MRTAAYKVDVAGDRRRRGNVPRHIFCYSVQLNLYKKCDTFTEEVLNKGNYLLWEQKIK